MSLCAANRTKRQNVRVACYQAWTRWQQNKRVCVTVDDVTATIHLALTETAAAVAASAALRGAAAPGPAVFGGPQLVGVENF